MNVIDFYTESVGSCSFNDHWSGHCAVVFVDRRAWNARAINSLPVSKVSNSYGWGPVVVIAVDCIYSDLEIVIKHGLEVQVSVQVDEIDFVVECDICSLFWDAGRRNIWVAQRRVNLSWIYCY